MIGSIFRWYRLLLPPWWAVACFAGLYLCLEGPFLYYAWLFKMPELLSDPKFVQGRPVIVEIGAVFYALFRVTFHPAYRAEYREWLSCTPWTADKPLPLAPVHLVAQDGIILVILLLMLHTTGRGSLPIVFTFLFAYQLAIVVTLLITGQRWMAYGVLFCLAIALRLAQLGVWGVVLLVLIYPLTYWAYLRGLASFPWRSKDALHNGVVLTLAAAGWRPKTNVRLGFPFQYISPIQVVPAISVAEGTAISLLAAAWAHALIANGPDAEARDAISYFACFVPVMIVTVGRLGLYCGNYWPPVSLLGRLASGRYIIRRYDQVFVAPLLALLVLVVGGVLLTNNRYGELYGMPVMLVLGLWINLNLGPKLLAWRLTGGHRLGLGFRSRQMFVEP